MKYKFETNTTMKEYNKKKYWIDGNYVPTITVEAENLKDALEEYREQVSKRAYMEISDNAMKNKKAMYEVKDGWDEQVGYVITGRTEIADDDYHYTR